MDEGRGSPNSGRRAARVRTLADALIPLLASFSEQHDRTGELAPEVISAFQERRLFWLLTPEAHGGLGLPPLDALAVLETISYGDAASGWVLMATSFGTSLAAGYLAQEAVDALFGAEPKAIICGHGAPAGRAIAVEGGFLLSGNWSYGSGIRYATHLHCGGVVYQDGLPRRLSDGSIETRQFVVPRELADYGANWDVLGLRATGSIDYSIENALVPEAYTQLATSRSTRAGPVFALGIAGMATIGHTAFALGVGRRSLDELAAYARISKGHFPPLSESEGFLEAFARHEGRLRAAGALVREGWRDLQDCLQRNMSPSARQETLIRVALLEATEAGAEASYFAYRSAGGTALRNGVIQRLFRDMHAATQHVLVGNTHLRECGKEFIASNRAICWNGLELAHSPA